MCDTHEAADGSGKRTFRPHVPDRFHREVVDDHRSNQILHDTLQASEDADDDTVWYNLMASHGPGEKPGVPRRFHVRATFENKGMGHPMIRDPLRTLIERDKAKLCDVFEVSDDELSVKVRPVERTVEPVELSYSDLPDDVAYPVTASGVAVTAYRCHGCERATLPDDFAEIDGEPACPRCGTRVDWDKTPPGDGFDEWEGPVDERTDDLVEAIRDPDGRVVDGVDTDVVQELERLYEDLRSTGNTFGEDLGADAHRAADRVRETVDMLTADDGASQDDVEDAVDDVGIDHPTTNPDDFPKTRPAEAAVRSYVERRLPDAAEDVDAGVIADMVENFVVSGTVWGENAVFEHDDTGADE